MDKTDELPPIDSGVAKIKDEYLISVSCQEKIEQKEIISNTEIVETSNKNNKFPNKKQRTGRNHHRPGLAKQARENKLCRFYWTNLPNEDTNKCIYEKCCFSHDIKSILSDKPQDIGDECHTFDTFGFCHYGVVCRFGNCHIKSGGTIIDQKKFDEYQKDPPFRNVLKQEVQISLRKRKFDFTKALNIFDEVTSSKQENAETKIDKNSESNDKSAEDDLNGHQTSELKTQQNETKCSEMEKTIGPASDEDLIPLRPSEKIKIDWAGKLYLAPLTTIGNLPFRRVCKRLGADVTCSEMALSTALLQGSSSEWALVKRHQTEDLFGVQLCGSHADSMIKCSQLLEQEVDMDFVDINMGCPIDLIYNKGGGSALMRRQNVVNQMVRGMHRVLSCPITLKMRTGVYRRSNVAHDIIQKAKLWDISLVTVHGRSREQRYVRLSDWDYVSECGEIASPMPLFGGGDILTYADYEAAIQRPGISGVMLARGAIMKPWMFTEIKEKREWDISASERLDIVKEFANNGLEHWGSDTEGVEKTRRFLLEWLSFLYRYIPLGLLERPQKINQRPPQYVGRSELETLLASSKVPDWVKISEMFLGPVPSDFAFLPKHRANSWG